MSWFNIKRKELRYDFIALDVETATSERQSICQLGLAYFRNGSIVEEFDQYIQPPNNEYLMTNINIHGIGPSKTENAPTLERVWRIVSPQLIGNLVISHNVEFDMDCIRAALRYYGTNMPDLKTDCTYKATGKKLIEVAQALSLNIDGHHDALFDAKLCGQVYNKLILGEKPDYSKVKAKGDTSSPFAGEGHERLGGDILKMNLEGADKEGFFYAKKVVFTGVLSKISRSEAAKIIQEMGADINTSISKNTHYIILGKDPGPSKMAKIKTLQSHGCPIEIIEENRLIEIIKEKP